MEPFEKIDFYQNTVNELRPFGGEMLKQIKDFLRLLHIPLPKLE